MKTYIVYVNGEEAMENGKPAYIKAASHNAAEKKAEKKYPGQAVAVSYTEV